MTNAPSVTYHSKAKGSCIPYVYANMTSSACPIKIQAKLVEHPISCVLVHNYEHPEYSLVRVCLAIGCCKIASKQLAIQHSQITSDYLAIRDRQIAITYIAKKERKNAKSI